jgi:cobalt-zinc-cadmium efflux system outer membrane protein
VARTKAQLRQAADRHAALAASIGSEVRMQRAKLVAARQLVEYYRDIVLPRRNRIVAQTQLEFNAMLVGLYQLLQSKQAQVEAERNYIEAQRDYWVARAELERALGGPLPQ